MNDSVAFCALAVLYNYEFCNISHVFITPERNPIPWYTSLPALVAFHSFGYNQHDGREMAPHCGFDLHFP